MPCIMDSYLILVLFGGNSNLIKISFSKNLTFLRTLISWALHRWTTHTDAHTQMHRHIHTYTSPAIDTCCHCSPHSIDSFFYEKVNMKKVLFLQVDLYADLALRTPLARCRRDCQSQTPQRIWGWGNEGTQAVAQPLPASLLESPSFPKPQRPSFWRFSEDQTFMLHITPLSSTHFHSGVRNAVHRNLFP